MDDDLDVVAVTGKGLVDCIIENLEHHVVQAGAIRCIADIHAWPLAHSLQTLKLLNAVLVVAAVTARMFHVKPFIFVCSRQLSVGCQYYERPTDN